MSKYIYQTSNANLQDVTEVNILAYLPHFFFNIKEANFTDNLEFSYVLILGHLISTPETNTIMNLDCILLNSVFNYFIITVLLIII